MTRIAMILALLMASPASAVTIEFVTVGDTDNAPNEASYTSFCWPDGVGAVAYEYQIAKHELTNAQYAEFLNAKAASDPLKLYVQGAAELYDYFGIVRDGSPGSYTYAVKPGFENKPALWINFYRAMRFANWMHNGQGSGDTETGAYTLLGGTPEPSNGDTVTRNPGATFAIPTADEWHKAAYYDGLSETYFRFPTGSNEAPTCAAPTETPNTANCDGDVHDVHADVGSYTGSPSPYGTFDQGGNVWEWTEEPSIRGGKVAGGYQGHPPTTLVRGCGYGVHRIAGGNVGVRLVYLTVPEP